MKKLTARFLLMTGLMASIFFACGEDEENGPTLPTISSIDPTSGMVGDTITISGTNLASATVAFGSEGATVLEPSATSLKAVVPQAAAGDYDVVATVNGNAATASAKFTIAEEPAGTETIAALAQGNNDLSTLVLALQKAELVETLNGTTQYTVFAPTNQAFTDAGVNVDDTDKEALAAVLQDHVVAGVKRVANLKNGDRLEALSGKILPVVIDGTTVTVGGATVTGADNEASNGIVHVVDKVVQPETAIITITDADLVAGETYDWTADNQYLLDGLVYVEEGATLNIAAGTVVKFKLAPSNTDLTSALFITRGAKIMAEGTAEAPIIFTSEQDDLTGTTLTPQDNAKWGGVVLLGKAPAEKGGITDAIQIEGIPSEEGRGQYGGTVADDNSGVLKYVSIRYTGVGFKAGDELQGLTLGGVGSGTTIDYVDIFSSADDGIEIFGGTVNIKHVSVAFATDDDFDFDLGYRGTAQFLFSIMRSDAEGYDHAGEWDGADPQDATLFSQPNIFNATFIGPGQEATGRDKAILARENFAGTFANSILVDFPAQGIEVQDLTPGSVASDSYKQLIDGQLIIANNTWSKFNSFTTMAELVKVTSKNGDDEAQQPDDPTGSTIADNLVAAKNTVVADVVVAGISRTADKGLDPRPTAEDADVYAVPAGLEAVAYRGAFSATGPTWLAGWTTLSKFGYLAE